MAALQKDSIEHFRIILFVATIAILGTAEGWWKVIVAVTWALLVLLLRYLTPIKEAWEYREQRSYK